MQRVAAAALFLLGGLGGTGIQMPEPASALVWSRTMKSRLRQVRFSPDGKYLLAQDDSEITVITALTFWVLFRIPTDKAGLAQFTPDSREVVFVSRTERRGRHQLVIREAPRLERWNIADEARSEDRAIPAGTCGTQELSPNGRTLACVDPGGTLRLIDVPSGQTICEKRNFVKPFVDQDAPFLREYGDLGKATIEFSPEGGFVIASPGVLGSPVAWDLLGRHSITLTGKLRNILWEAFVFVTPDRILISHHFNHGKTFSARLVAFPSGALVSRAKLPPGPLFRAADPSFVLIRPFGQLDDRDPEPNRAAAVEFGTGQVIVSNASAALDVFRNHYVAELADGKLGLYERGKGLQAKVNLRLEGP